MIKTVSLFGTARARAGDKNFKTAEKLGRMLAEAGFAIANGGYDGTMLAAAKGAKQAGGEVIGVTCSTFERRCANEFITKEIITKSLQERLDELIKMGDAYVVLPGGTGTLLELALAWELKNKGFLLSEKPIILLGEFWEPLIELVEADDKNAGKYLTKANNPEEVIEILKKK